MKKAFPFKNVEKEGEFIGEGTYSDVYMFCKSGEKIAIKISKEYFHITSQTVFREYITLSSVNHENIVKVNEIYIDEGRMYVSMELCEKTLSDVFASENKKHDTTIKRYMHSLSKAVAYLHSKNIWHRDIKPANILLDKDDNIKLCDFSLAKFGDCGSHSNEVCTMHWRPPELLLGVNKYGAEIDVWSLGIIFVNLYFWNGNIFDTECIQQQLKSLNQMVGGFDSVEWPEFISLCIENNSIFCANETLESINSGISSVPWLCDKLDAETYDLVKIMLTPNPNKRADMNTVLNHKFFDFISPKYKYVNGKSSYIMKPINAKCDISLAMKGIIAMKSIIEMIRYLDINIKPAEVCIHTYYILNTYLNSKPKLSAEHYAMACCMSFKLACNAQLTKIIGFEEIIEFTKYSTNVEGFVNIYIDILNTVPNTVFNINLHKLFIDLHIPECHLISFRELIMALTIYGNIFSKYTLEYISKQCLLLIDNNINVNHEIKEEILTSLRKTYKESPNILKNILKKITI